MTEEEYLQALQEIEDGLRRDLQKVIQKKLRFVQSQSPPVPPSSSGLNIDERIKNLEERLKEDEHRGFRFADTPESESKCEAVRSCLTLWDGFDSGHCGRVRPLPDLDWYDERFDIAQLWTHKRHDS